MKRKRRAAAPSPGAASSLREGQGLKSPLSRGRGWLRSAWRWDTIWALAGGVVTAVCFLPYGLAPFLPIGPALLIAALRRAPSPRRAAWCGAVFGVASYAAGMSVVFGLLRYSWLALALFPLGVLYILPFSTTVCAGAVWLERRAGLPRALGLALLYVISEKLRTLTDLSLPGDLLTHAFGAHPAWLAWTPWTGPYVVALLVFLTAGLLETAAHRTLRHPRLAVPLFATALALWCAAPLSEGWLRDEFAPDRRSLKVGIVQPFVSVDDKLDERRAPAVWAKLERLTRQAAPDVDLVVWPETARPGFVMFEEGEPLADERMEALSRDLDVPILYGAEVASVVSADSGRRRLTGLYNGALLVTPEGGTVDWYAKRRLLPFIEGVPFAHMLGWNPYSEDRSRSRGSYLTMVGNFRPGPKATIFELGAARIGVLICYEGLYPQLVRTHRLAGANILAVLTNDAWWGESLVPWWHAQLASCRAREAGIPVMRAANHGISSTSNLFGRILDRSDLSEVVVLESEVRIGSAEPTFYARQGDWLIWLVTAVLGVSFARAGVLALIAGRKSVSSGDLSGLPSE